MGAAMYARLEPNDPIWDASVFLIRLLREDDRLEKMPPAARRETLRRHAERVAAEFAVPVKDLAKVTADLISGQAPRLAVAEAPSP